MSLRSWSREVLPLPSSELALNPPQLFQKYSDAADQVTSTTVSSVSRTMLEEARRLFDEEGSRRESINARTGVLLGTSGVLGAVIVAGGQIGLGSARPVLTIYGKIALVCYLLAILYVALGIIYCLIVQSVGRGHVMGPDDLPISPNTKGDDEYRFVLAGKLMGYATENYRLANRSLDRMQTALKCVRNGLIALLLVGLLIPWSTSAGSSVSPSTSCQPCQANNAEVRPALQIGSNCTPHRLPIRLRAGAGAGLESRSEHHCGMRSRDEMLPRGSEPHRP